MLARLVKFLLLTRFSKPLLAFIGIYLVYFVVLGRFNAVSGSPIASEIGYYGAGFTAFVFAIMTLGGGMVVMKSDRDYLFTLPLDKRELALGLYVSQFVASGIMVFFVFGLFGSIMVFGGADYLLLIVDMAALALCATSLAVISNALKTEWRLLLGALLSIWALSSLAGFAFSPASIFTGGVMYGSMAMVGLTAVVTALSLKELSHVELGTMRSLIRATSSEMKNMRTFAGSSPARAVFSLKFGTIEIGGGANMGGSRYQGGGIRLSRVIPVACVLALVYGYLALTLGPGGGMAGFGLGLFAYLLVGFSLVSSQVGMSTERAWLALTSLEPSSYFRYVSIAKALSFAAIFSPFAAVNIVLALLGVQGALPLAVTLIFTIPSWTVPVLYLSSWASPIQIKEEAPMMPSQFNLRQMAMTIPIVAMLVAVEASIYIPLASVVVGVASVGLAVFIVYDRNAWNKLAERLVENGFV